MLRRLAWTAALLCAAAALILHPQVCMQAVRDSLALCGETIVPSLFPFFVLSGMVVELGLAGALGRLLERVMWPLFRVGGSGATALVLGLVGGYPVGARTAVELYRTGQCSRTETERLLAFCNNSGPAFVLGVVGAGVFGSTRTGALLYLVHVAASLCVGVLFRFYGAQGEKTGGGVPHTVGAVRISEAFTGSVRAALSGVLNVCAFVVTFGVLNRLLEETGLLGGAAQLLAVVGMDAEQAHQLLRGLLEVSSGVSGLTGEGRLTIAAFLLGWAGLSVHCQVMNLLADSGLRANTYLAGKALHGAVSAALMTGLGRLFPQVLPAVGWLGRPENQLSGVWMAVVAAWLLWTLFLIVAAGDEKCEKKGGKGRRVAV